MFYQALAEKYFTSVSVKYRNVLRINPQNSWALDLLSLLKMRNDIDDMRFLCCLEMTGTQFILHDPACLPQILQHHATLE